MNEELMKIVRKELAAFRKRGGDDLVAKYENNDDDPSVDPGVSLLDRTTGRVHCVSVQDGCGVYIANASIFASEKVHGIRTRYFYASQSGGMWLSRKKASRDAFAKELGQMLDKYKGQFTPLHEVGVSTHPNSPDLLKIIGETLPDDGSITILCNTESDPRDDEDHFSFVGPEGLLDLRVRTAPGKVVVHGANGEIGTFKRSDDWDGLREVVEAGLSANVAPAP